MDDIKLAMLGSKEAAKRLTEQGVLLPCPGCAGYNIHDGYRYSEAWCECVDCGWKGPSVYEDGFVNTKKARLAWNTRAAIGDSDEH